MKNTYLTIKCVPFQNPHLMYIPSIESKENENNLGMRRENESKLRLPKYLHINVAFVFYQSPNLSSNQAFIQTNSSFLFVS